MSKKDKKRQSEAGFVVTLELLFISVILVIGLVVGLVTVRDAMITELADLSEAIGAIDQSYEYDSVANLATAQVSGSSFFDQPDTDGLIEIIDLETGNATLEFTWASTPPFSEGDFVPLP